MKRRMGWMVGLVVTLLGLTLGCDSTTQAPREEPAPEVAQPPEAAQAPDLLAEAREQFAPLPQKMPGAENDTPVQIELGKALYFETALSINHTQSCNSCHRLDENLGGVDNLPTSKGADGEFGDRNSPTTLNAGLHIAQFWDGRAPDLVAQAKGPVLNSIEMAMPDEAAVLARLEEAGYGERFMQAFPQAEPALTYDNYAEAVAAFERTLITRDRFDDFLGGERGALTSAEKDGLRQFMEIGCSDCHDDALLGGNGYERMGQVHAYANEKDLGRFGVTGDEDDRYVFKVPSLRNIALTGPYFHDGQAGTLADAVRQMAWLQLDEELDAGQVGAIVVFLGSLTDKERAVN
jgi:cytochrome c peroxidase